MYLTFYILRSILITVAAVSMQRPLLKADRSPKMRFAWYVLFSLAFLHVLEGIALGSKL
jgi:hypothetical protein